MCYTCRASTWPGYDISRVGKTVVVTRYDVSSCSSKGNKVAYTLLTFFFWRRAGLKMLYHCRLLSAFKLEVNFGEWNIFFWGGGAYKAFFFCLKHTELPILLQLCCIGKRTELLSVDDCVLGQQCSSSVKASASCVRRRSSVRKEEGRFCGFLVQPTVMASNLPLPPPPPPKEHCFNDGSCWEIIIIKQRRFGLGCPSLYQVKCHLTW